MAFREAMSDDFKEYQKQVVRNASVMADEFNENGLRVISGGTDNHLILLDVTTIGKTGKEAEEILESVNITVNKNTIPNEKLKPTITSGIRIGSPSITSRGFKEKEARLTAQLISKALSDRDSVDEVKKEVEKLTNDFPLY